MIHSQTQTKSKATGTTARRLALVMALGAVALLAVPATGTAATKFGAKLNDTVQPSNSLPAHLVRAGDARSVYAGVDGGVRQAGRRREGAQGRRDRQDQADRGRLGPLPAPARTGEGRPEEAKIVHQGPRIDYEGQDPNWNEPYEVEKFNVNLPVSQGRVPGHQGAEDEHAAVQLRRPQPAALPAGSAGGRSVRVRRRHRRLLAAARGDLRVATTAAQAMGGGVPVPGPRRSLRLPGSERLGHRVRDFIANCPLSLSDLATAARVLQPEPSALNTLLKTSPCRGPRP